MPLPSTFAGFAKLTKEQWLYMLPFFTTLLTLFVLTLFFLSPPAPPPKKKTCAQSLPAWRSCVCM